MASLYKRGNVWWIKSKDWSSGEVWRRSTGLRVDSVVETKRANRVLRDAVAAEVASRAEFAGRAVRDDGDLFERWVPDWLDAVYQHKSRHTVSNNFREWGNVFEWLKAKGVVRPLQVRRALAMEFFQWRTSVPAADGSDWLGLEWRCRRPVRAVTAKREIALLSRVMDEAVLRELCDGNPVARLRFAVEQPRVKPCITVEEEALIREELRSRPVWMRRAFSIAMAQGLRLSATRIDLVKQVDLERGLLKVPAMKGHREFTVQLHPSLVRLFAKLREDGERWSRPTFAGESAMFCKFFREIGMPHLSFHCTRVTAITRVAKSGRVSRNEALAFFAHASNAVHDVYTRLDPIDGRSALDVLPGADEVDW